MELKNLENVDNIVTLNNGQLIVCVGDGYLWKGTENNLTLVDENDDETYNLYFKLCK